MRPVDAGGLPVHNVQPTNVPDRNVVQLILNKDRINRLRKLSEKKKKRKKAVYVFLRANVIPMNTTFYRYRLGCTTNEILKPGTLKTQIAYDSQAVAAQNCRVFDANCVRSVLHFHHFLYNCC